MKNDYEIRGDVTAIFVKNKGRIFEALISTSKLEKAKEFPNTWFANWCPSRKAFYASGHLPRNGWNQKTMTLHRWILEVCDSTTEVDHYDLNPLNNTDDNLRIVTHAQNLQNRSVQSNNKSGFRGVAITKNVVNGKQIAELTGSLLTLVFITAKKKLPKQLSKQEKNICLIPKKRQVNKIDSIYWN